jgi:hypothetical protein
VTPHWWTFAASAILALFPLAARPLAARASDRRLAALLPLIAGAFAFYAVAAKTATMLGAGPVTRRQFLDEGLIMLAIAIASCVVSAILVRAVATPRLPAAAAPLILTALCIAAAPLVAYFMTRPVLEDVRRAFAISMAGAQLAFLTLLFSVLLIRHGRRS